jgi:hypothetical protein
MECVPFLMRGEQLCPPSPRSPELEKSSAMILSAGLAHKGRARALIKLQQFQETNVLFKGVRKPVSLHGKFVQQLERGVLMALLLTSLFLY